MKHFDFASKTLLVPTTLALLVLGVLCSREYNPFADSSNSRVVVKSCTFQDGDTVEIYAVDTMRVSVAAAENVDSFTVKSTGNRLWSDMCVREGLQGTTFSLAVSFYDTGWQELTVVTHRAGLRGVSMTYRVRAESPLVQMPVIGQYDTPVSLSTTPVAAGDVLYHWDFGRGSVVHSPFPDTSVGIHDAGFTDTGYVWVTDLKNEHASPRTPFTYAFDDDVGPSIVCVNEGFVNKDTIISARPSLPLRFSITDRGLSTVYSAMVDGGEFDFTESGIYVKIFNRLDTVTGYRPVLVTAIDNAYYKNATEDTFYVAYDSTAVMPSGGTNILVLVPPSDSLVFGNRERNLYGLVQNFSGDSIDYYIQFTVNDSTYTTTIPIAGDQRRFEWSANVWLAQDVNRVTLGLHSASGTVMSDTSMTFFYDADRIDTLAPVIVSVTSNGTDLHRLYTDTNRVPVRVIAFDEGSGIASVSVASHMMSAADSTGYFWDDTITVPHEAQGANLNIVVKDKMGMSTSRLVTVYYNRSPEIQRTPSPPLPVFADNAYYDTIRVRDRDWQDTVRVWKKNAPPGFVVDSIGNIYWKPTALNVGTHTIEISYSDNVIPEPKTYTYEIIVDDSADFSLPRFATKEQDFPAFVVVGDTMSLVLAASTGYGLPPYTFDASAEAGFTKPTVTGGTLTWAPTAADTGYRRINVFLSDSYREKDTLVPIILVVPANKPCSLSVTHSLDTVAGGALDLSWSTAPETLAFTIHDDDHPTAENHTVSVDYTGSATVGGVDSSNEFSVIIDPRGITNRNDTLRVKVTDRVGHEFSLELVLHYGMAYKNIFVNTGASGAAISSTLMDFPVLVRLASSNFDFSQARTNGEDIRFSKPNGEALHYEIERWDKSSQKAAIWVRMDTVKANNSDQHFRMFFGDPNAIDSSNGSAVFDTGVGYAGVWHLGEKGGTTRSDATANGNHGTTVNYSGGNWKEGVIGICDSALDTTSYITMGNPASLRITGPITVSAWVYGYHRTQKIMSKHDWGSGEMSWSFYHETVGGENLLVGLSKDGITEKYLPVDSISSNEDAWNFCTFTFDPATQYCRASINGEFQQVSTGWAMGTKLHNSSTDFLLRANRKNDEILNVLRLALDEARVSNVARGDDWLRLCYETQKPNSTCVTVVDP